MKSTNIKTTDVNVSGGIDFKPEFTRPCSVKIGSVKTGLCEFAPDFENMLVKNRMLNWKQRARKGSDLKSEQNESVEDEKKTDTRLRAWSIDPNLKCPVVGTCMSMKEQRKLLKKTGWTIKNLSDCQVHHAFVKALLSKNDLSVCVDQHLVRKFKKEMPEFFNIDKALFLKTWAKAYKKGEIEGLLWVAAVRPDLTCEDNVSIFEDVHMLMHINAEQNSKQRRQFCFQQKENEKLAQKIVKTRGAIKALKKENAGALNKCTLLEKEKKKLEDELSKLRRIMEESGKEFGGDAKNSKLKDDLQGLAKEVTDCRQRIKALAEQNNRLNSKLARQREINTGLREETEKVVSQISSLNRCDESCPSFDLCRKRILIVGGITKIESLYRKLIEENGGIFEYHDGYMSGGVKMLENRLKRSDVVFCPVDCNSHVACLTVKKLGKKHKKDVRMLAGSGLSAISHALSECGKDAACAIRN